MLVAELAFLGGEGAAEEGLAAKDIEEIGGDAGADEALGLGALGGQVHAAVR